MKEQQVIPNRSYIVTPCTIPLTIFAVLDGGEKVELLYIMAKEQRCFLAISDKIEFTQDDAYISLVENFNGALSRMSSGEGTSLANLHGNFIQYSEGSKTIERVHWMGKHLDGTMFMGAIFEEEAREWDMDVVAPNIVTMTGQFAVGSNLSILRGTCRLTESPSLYYWLSTPVIDLRFPQITSKGHSYWLNVSVTRARLVLDKLRDVSFLASNSRANVLERVEIVGNIERADQICFCSQANESLTEMIMDWSKVVSAVGAFVNRKGIRGIDCFGGSINLENLSDGTDMFKQAGLTSAGCDAIMNALPSYSSGTHKITFTGCPGAGECNPLIATTKGWIVQI